MDLSLVISIIILLLLGIAVLMKRLGWWKEKANKVILIMQMGIILSIILLSAFLIALLLTKAGYTRGGFK